MCHLIDEHNKWTTLQNCTYIYTCILYKYILSVYTFMIKFNFDKFIIHLQLNPLIKKKKTKINVFNRNKT